MSGRKQHELNNSYKTITIVTQEVPVEERKDMFFKEYPVFVRHKELAKNQHTMIQEVNGNLIKDICTVNIYFIENIVSNNIKEILSAYFNKKNSICRTLHGECSR